MNEEIESINQILPNVHAGVYDYATDEEHEGGKTRAIQDWIRRVQQEIVRYKVEHYRLLSLAAAALAHVSPNEIVIDSALSFLQLPDHVFEGEGDSSATTPALDRKLWENIVQIEQGLLEKDTELRSQRPIEKDKEIAVLKAQNDEKGDEIHQLKMRVAQLELRVAVFSEVMAKNDADGLTTKRPRGS